MSDSEWLELIASYTGQMNDTILAFNEYLLSAASTQRRLEYELYFVVVLLTARIAWDFYSVARSHAREVHGR